MLDHRRFASTMCLFAFRSRHFFCDAVVVLRKPESSWFSLGFSWRYSLWCTCNARPIILDDLRLECRCDNQNNERWHRMIHAQRTHIQCGAACRNLSIILRSQWSPIWLNFLKIATIKKNGKILEYKYKTHGTYCTSRGSVLSVWAWLSSVEEKKEIIMRKMGHLNSFSFWIKNVYVSCSNKFVNINHHV